MNNVRMTEGLVKYYHMKNVRNNKYSFYGHINKKQTRREEVRLLYTEDCVQIQYCPGLAQKLNKYFV